MGRSHACAYHRNPASRLSASRAVRSNRRMCRMNSRAISSSRDFDEALATTEPDAVSINTWPNRTLNAIEAMESSAHVCGETDRDEPR
jgi:predicted dehydrogenase